MMKATKHRLTGPLDSSIRPQRRADSGQSLVELGILVPVFVVILVGVLDFGRILMVRHIITNAAREGARVASVADQYSSSPLETTRSYLERGGLSLSQATITITGANAPSGQPTTVTVSYQVTSLALQVVHASSSAITLSTTSSMLRE
jgi:Flp pilus assembly protein TadG